MPVILLNRIEKRKVSVFLSCLLIAVFSWLFFALSNNYVYEVDSKLNFINPPLNKAYHPLQDDTVTLQVRGTGWQLLFSKLNLKSQIVDISLQSLSSSHYVVISKQLNNINLQFESNQKVISVSPDTLFFDFTKRITKRVPIKLLSKLTFAKAYGVSGPVKLEPATVVITGAAEDLKEIKFWQTDTLLMENISSTITTKIGFQKGLKNNVNVYPNAIKVEIPVDEFTEKTIEVPVEVENNPGREIKIIPEKARITLLTALSNYSGIERESIKVSVDYDDWAKHNYLQLPVRITKFPPFSKLVKIDPQIVDFIIK